MTPPRPTLRIGTHTSGGPSLLLAQELQNQGLPADVVHRFEFTEWSNLIGRNRRRARIESLLVYPLQAVWDALRQPHPAILIPTTNPFTLPFLLIATRPLHQMPVVPLLWDVYPDALEAAGATQRGSLLSRILARANEFVFSRADGLVFIGRRMAQSAFSRYGEPSRWTRIETGCVTAQFETPPGPPVDELDAWMADRTMLSYVGNLGQMHDWETMAKAVPKVLERYDGERPLGILVASSGQTPELKDAWKQLPEVRFCGPLDDDRWLRVMQRTHISLVTLRSEARATCVPSKAYSALAASCALCAVAPRDSDLGELVERHDVGIFAEPGDVKGLERELLALLSDPTRLEATAQHAFEVARQHFDMPALVQRWKAFLAPIAVGPRPSLRRRLAKRALDVAASGAALLATAPIMIPVSLAVYASMGSPIFFAQERPGLHGRPFKLKKFRTMREPKPGEARIGSDADRITRVGRFLRKTSLDEFPTFLNVLLGDMSLVGPRPLLMRYLERYSTEQARRHEVKPGITGWAQVNGRNAISWEEKFKLDVWYVDHASLWLDIKILFMTVLKVFKREGVSAEGHVTMPEFMGSES